MARLMAAVSCIFACPEPHGADDRGAVVGLHRGAVGFGGAGTPRQPEGVGVDSVIDAMINWVAFLGLLGTAAWSVGSVWAQWESPRRGRLAVRLIASGFFGPLLATVAVTVIGQDVDGAMWMIISPGLGLVLVVLGLAVVAVTHRNKRERAG